VAGHGLNRPVAGHGLNRPAAGDGLNRPAAGDGLNRPVAGDTDQAGPASAISSHMQLPWPRAIAGPQQNLTSRLIMLPRKRKSAPARIEGTAR
jgi:hypothetical protein